MSEDRSTRDAINELAKQVAALREDFRAATEHDPKARHRQQERLTPQAVRNTRFVTSRLRPGYVEQEVDAFLDLVEQELETLIRERDDARAENAELRKMLPRGEGG